MVQTLTRTKNGIKQLLIPGMWFENMGVTYIGPVDGHNVRQLVRIFKEAKKMDHAVDVYKRQSLIRAVEAALGREIEV